jgi:hypothetical protein
MDAAEASTPDALPPDAETPGEQLESILGRGLRRRRAAAAARHARYRLGLANLVIAGSPR